MKRLIVQVLICLLFVGNVFAAQPMRRGVEPESLAYNGRVYADSGSVTSGQFANWTYRMAKEQGILYLPTLSGVTMNISTASGYAFVSNPSLNLAQFANSGKLITLTAPDGKQMSFYAGAAGTGETTGSDVLAGWDFTSGWAIYQGTITGAATFTATGSVVEIFKSLFPVGKLYKGQLSGTAQQGTLGLYNSATQQYLPADTLGYFTARTNNDCTVRVSGTANGKTANISILMAQPVLTPSSTGAWMLQANGTAGYVSMDSGFSFTGPYTVTIAGSQINSGVHAWASEFAGKFDGSGYTSKLYDLAPINPQDVVQATGAAQSQKVANSQNSKSVLRFNGSTMSLTSASATGITVASGALVMSGINWTGTHASNGDISLLVGSGSINYAQRTWRINPDSKLLVDCFANNTSSTEVVFTGGTPYIVSAQFNSDKSALGYVNGVSQASGTMPLIQNAETGVNIGGFLYYFFHGDFYFGLITPSTTNRTAIESFFNSAYGVY
jgi:hypothetical protein